MTSEEKALLEETIVFYSKNPRGMLETICVYYDPNTKVKCAIGRLLSDTALDQLVLLMGFRMSRIRVIYDEFIDNPKRFDGLVELQTELKNLFDKYSIDFLNELQDFHDYELNWVPNATEGSDLSTTGKDFILNQF